MYRNETGKDAALLFQGTSTPVTNWEFHIELETSESDFSDTFEQWSGYTSGHATGSFEWDGSQPKVFSNAFETVNGISVPLGDMRLRCRLTEESFWFGRLRITDFGRTAPADDKTDGTVEWRADRWKKTGNGFGGAGNGVPRPNLGGEPFPGGPSPS